MEPTDLFAGAMLALYTAGGECADPSYRPMPVSMPDGMNDRPVQFGPWRGDEAGITGWALLVSDGGVLDSGLLAKRRNVKRGDRVVFPRGAIKSAVVGDLLGITAVFMPSGFAVAVPRGGGGAAAYPEQQVYPTVFWLPKRRWQELPRTVDYLEWRKRLGTPEVGVREVVLRRRQELVAAGVL